MAIRSIAQLALVVCVAIHGTASADDAVSKSALYTQLQDSSKAGTFTFIVFHRQNDDATRLLYQQTQSGIAAYPGKATVVTARVDDPAERAFVDQFGISRAPMPLTVAVAPNGAVTGVFPRTLGAEQISAAIVSPTMMACMKELQQNKLVFVCLAKNGRTVVPPGVQALQLLPEFRGRISTVGMTLNDPAEDRLYQQMRLDANQVKGPYAVLIAPPGVLIGHFTSLNPVEQIAAAIHKAGQCCEDPNCKHGKSAPTQNTTGSR